MIDPKELAAVTPEPVNPNYFNPAAELPYGLAVEHVSQAMAEFVNFLGYVNQQLATREIARLETMLMPANFSSIVGEFMSSGIPKYCDGLVKNRYHNGHPDLIPRGVYPDDAVQHVDVGVEVKGSRKKSGWQGHNPEDIWLMVYVFDCDSPRELTKGNPPRPFRFLKVVGARLVKDDWKYSGRTGKSRRTITATVTKTGRAKMEANWIYRVPPPPPKPRKRKKAGGQQALL